MRKRERIISIIFFILAGLLAAYSVWAFINCQSYISEMVSAGQLTISGNEYDIVNFYMSNCLQHMIFAIVLFGIGWLVSMQQPVTVQDSSAEGSGLAVEPQEEDDELDEWFEEMKRNE